MKKIVLLLIFGAALNVCVAAKHTTLPHSIYQPKNDPDDGTKLKLIIGGKTYDIQMYNLIYNPKDDKSKNDETAIGFYSGSVITISIRSSRLDQEFVDWIFDPNQKPQDGQLIAYDAESGKSIREITFTGATVSSYNENNNAFNFSSNGNQIVGLTLKYKTITVKATSVKI
jgi:hypothetical protein